MLSLEEPITDRELLEAVCIRCSICFPAMNIANALGGSQSRVWKVVRKFKLDELVREMTARNLLPTNLKEAVGDRRLVDIPSYQEAMKEITSG